MGTDAHLVRAANLGKEVGWLVVFWVLPMRAWPLTNFLPSPRFDRRCYCNRGVQYGWVKTGDYLIAIHGMRDGASGASNMLKVLVVP